MSAVTASISSSSIHCLTYCSFGFCLTDIDDFFLQQHIPLSFQMKPYVKCHNTLNRIDAELPWQWGEENCLLFFIFPCCSRDIFTEPCLSFQPPYFPKHPNLQPYWTIWRLLYHTLSHFFAAAAAAAQCSFICFESALTSSPQLKYDLPAHLPLYHFFSFCASTITLTTMNCKFLLICFFPIKLWPSSNQRTCLSFLH